MRQPTPLKRAIFESQRTQREIAAEIGTDPAHLSRIVNGLQCDLPMREAIVAALARSVAPGFVAPTVEDLWPTSSTRGVAL